MVADPNGSVRIVKLSPAMLAALELAEKYGSDSLRRVAGGFWLNGTDVTQRYARKPGDSYAATGTVRALVARGVMAWSEWSQNRAGRFPVCARIVKQQ